MRYLLILTVLFVSAPRLSAQIASEDRAYKDQIQSFQLGNADVQEVVKILNDQFPGNETFSANATTNMIYARIPDIMKPEVEEFIQTLEKDAADSAVRSRKKLEAFTRSASGGGLMPARTATNDSKRTMATFRVNHVSAVELMLIIGNLGYFDGDLSVALGPHEDSLIARGTEGALVELDEFIKSVDQPSTAKKKPASGDEATASTLRSRLLNYQLEYQKLRDTMGPQHPSALQLLKQIETVSGFLKQLGSSAPELTGAGSTLRETALGLRPKSFGKAYETAEREAARLADQWRREKATGKLAEKDLQKLREKVKEQVKIAFKTRQDQKRAELKKAEEQLKAVRERLEMRDRIADKVIERRLEDLIGGVDLSWLSPDDQAANESIIKQRIAKSKSQPSSDKTKLADSLASGTKSDVQIEYVEELGTMIVRGAREDVKRVVDVIETIDGLKPKRLGTVTRVNESESNVLLDAGSGKGLKVGQKYNVIRNGKMIGLVEVTSVANEDAIAKIFLLTNPKVNVTVGDDIQPVKPPKNTVR